MGIRAKIQFVLVCDGCDLSAECPGYLDQSPGEICSRLHWRESEGRVYCQPCWDRGKGRRKVSVETGSSSGAGAAVKSKTKDK